MNKLIKIFRMIAVVLIAFTLILCIIFIMNENGLEKCIKIVFAITTIFTAFTVGCQFEMIYKKIISKMEDKEEQKKNTESMKPYRHQFAIHEAGHAIVASALLPEIAINQITIKPEGSKGGSVNYSEDVKLVWNKQEYIYLIARTYGGRAAEEFLLKTVSTDAYEDMISASEYAYNMVNRYGLGKSLVTQIDDDSFDALLAAKNLENMKEICEEAYKIAKSTICQNQHAVLKLVELLEEKEVLNYEEVKDFMIRNDVYPDNS